MAAAPKTTRPAAAQTQEQFAAVPAGIDASERHVDPTRDSLQRKVQIDHTRRSEPGAWVNLPNGEAVRVQGAVGMKYPGEKATDMLARPQDMMLNPKPAFRNGPRYQWRVRTSSSAADNRPAETANLHRAQRIRYVETNELDPACEFAVYTEYATPNNTYVTYQTLILCEIMDERLAYQTYKGWEDWAIHKVTNIEAETRSQPGTRVVGKTDVSVDIRDPETGR